MKSILECDHPDLKFPPELEADRKAVLAALELKDIIEPIERLANNEFIVSAFNNRGHFKIQIPCVSQYYWANVRRFASENFIPTKEDFLYSRIKTSGIQTLEFTVSDTKFMVVDVGGQRSERRKWLHCFDNVLAIIFLTAIDEYDMFLEEENELSRLDESLSLWNEVTSSQYFKPLAWILFLNKYDCLKKKIESTSLHKYFADISEDDGRDLNKCVQYIRSKYLDKYSGTPPLYIYETCAIDTNNCDKVFEAVRDSILLQALKDVDLT